MTDPSTEGGPSVIVATEPQLSKIISSAVERAIAEHEVQQGSDPTPPDSEWLPNADAPDTIGVSRSTLARWRKSGQLPYAKVGQNIFYRYSDLNAFLADHLCEGRQ